MCVSLNLEIQSHASQCKAMRMWKWVCLQCTPNESIRLDVVIKNVYSFIKQILSPHCIYVQSSFVLMQSFVVTISANWIHIELRLIRFIELNT